jgi:hypothetical protein
LIDQTIVLPVPQGMGGERTVPFSSLAPMKIGISWHQQSLISTKEYVMSLNIFFYVSLAAWRLASLIANEDGPWLMFRRFRQRAEQWCNKYRFCRELGLYELVTCEWCSSIWIGAVLTALYLWIGETILYLALPLALSTVAIIIKYVVQLLQTAQQFLDTTNRSQK